MKRINELAALGFQIDKVSQIAYGVIDQYHYVIYYNKRNRNLSLQTNAALSKEDHVDLMKLPLNAIDQLTYQNQVLKMVIKDSRKVAVQDIEKMLHMISLFLKQKNAAEVCSFCGKEKEVHICRMQGDIDLVCDDCLSQYQTGSQSMPKAKFSRGLIGLLGGAVIGMVIWILIYQLGYIAGISGLFMSYLCIKGYEKFAGSLDKKGLAAAVIIALLMLAAAELICINIEIAKAFEISFFEALDVLPDFLEEDEIISAVFQDLAFGYIFMLAASYSLYLQEYRRIKRQGVYEKILN